MRRGSLTGFLAAASLCGCVQVPELDLAISDSAKAAPYPELIPVEDIRAGIPKPRISGQTQPALESRTDGLRRKVDSRQSPVIDPKTKDRMLRGIDVQRVEQAAAEADARSKADAEAAAEADTLSDE